MKQLFTVCRLALLVMVLASLAACKGGTFSDPGAGSSGSGSDSSGSGSDSASKPAKLAGNATYGDVLNKLDEIIAYCGMHPNTQNNAVKSSVEAVKNNAPSTLDKSEEAGEELVKEINALIDQLK